MKASSLKTASVPFRRAAFLIFCLLAAALLPAGCGDDQVFYLSCDPDTLVSLKVDGRSASAPEAWDCETLTADLLSDPPRRFTLGYWLEIPQTDVPIPDGGLTKSFSTGGAGASGQIASYFSYADDGGYVSSSVSGEVTLLSLKVNEESWRVRASFTADFRDDSVPAATRSVQMEYFYILKLGTR